MGSRNGARPVILSARCGFEPTRWQDQTLATAYRLVFAQSPIEPRSPQPVAGRIGLSSVGMDQGLSLAMLNETTELLTYLAQRILRVGLVRAAGPLERRTRPRVPCLACDSGIHEGNALSVVRSPRQQHRGPRPQMEPQPAGRHAVRHHRPRRQGSASG